MSRSGLGFRGGSEEAPPAPVPKAKPKPSNKDAGDSNEIVQQRTFDYVNHNEDEPAVVEYSDVDPRNMLAKSEEWSDKEKKKFKKNKDKKRTGSLKLKGMQLKGVGKTAHFTKAGPKREKKDITAEELLDQRTKQKYDKFC